MNPVIRRPANHARARCPRSARAPGGLFRIVQPRPRLPDRLALSVESDTSPSRTSPRSQARARAASRSESTSPTEGISAPVSSEQFALLPELLRVDRRQPEPLLHFISARRRMARPVVVEVAVDLAHFRKYAPQVLLPLVERVGPVDQH